MKNPLDVGSKTIDAATIHCVRRLSPERTATLNTDKDFAYEIRTINGDGAFIEAGTPLASIVAGFAKIGEELTLLGADEAIRKDWIASVKDFVSRPDQPAKYNSVVKLPILKTDALPKSGSPPNANRSSVSPPNSMSSRAALKADPVPESSTPSKTCPAP